MKLIKILSTGFSNKFKNIFTSIKIEDGYSFEIKNRFDFKLIESYFKTGKIYTYTYNDRIILSNGNNLHDEIHVNKAEIITKNGLSYSIFEEGEKELEYYPSEKIYKLNGGNYEFTKSDDTSLLFIKTNIIEYYNWNRTNNYLRCINPDGGAELWRLDLPWHIGKIDIYEHYIIFEYREYPNVYESGPFAGEIIEHERIEHTICLDGNTGQELWRWPGGYQKIDPQYGVILTGLRVADEEGYRIGSRTIELDIATGKELTNQLLTPFVEDSIFGTDFVDETAIYYRHDKGAFGKINKADGSIVWEFFLIDENNKKRILGNWLKLGNGKFVLQALTHTKNGENLGELMCIFDPEENMEFSNVKNGVRVTALG